MSNDHDHSDEMHEKLCCGVDILQQGIHNAMHRIEDKNANKLPCLYSTEGTYEDILAQFLKNRQKRLSEINKATGDSWTVLEKAFESLESNGFQTARYMQTHETDMAECLNLMSQSCEKAFLVYSNYSIFDEQKRFNLLLYANKQPLSAYGSYCKALSSENNPELFEEVISTLNQVGLHSKIGDHPDIIAISGIWNEVKYSEIDTADLDFHLEVRIGLEQVNQGLEL